MIGTGFSVSQLGLFNSTLLTIAQNKRTIAGIEKAVMKEVIYVEEFLTSQIFECDIKLVHHGHVSISK